jgi:hypothetical protein
MSSIERFCRVDLVKTEVSEGHITSIFRIDKSAIEEKVWRRYVPPRHRFLRDSDGATSQKTAFFRPGNC